MSGNKRELIESMGDNEQIYCDYCGSECTASSLKYGNTLLEKFNKEIWYQWDFICLDCSEKLSSRLDNDHELYQSMYTNFLIHLGIENRKANQS